MGAWDVGPFDNDAALDWVGDLDDAEGWEPVAAVLRFAEVEGFVDAEDASEGLAAAEVVAAGLGRAREEVPEEVTWFLGRVGHRPSPELVALAGTAVQRILGDDSELRGLWEDTDDLDAWLADTEGLVRRLGVAEA
ncbi:MAG: DUF4259 domain-containing protein [Alphaproteobacteria bacterium]|nr:DUF4259 domain-containing protein [Alphaproteobacteria bacterium]